MTGAKVGSLGGGQAPRGGDVPAPQHHQSSQPSQPSQQSIRWPDMKPKRNTYEWFIPKGILKKNWMSKHLYELPSVVVVFMELDWNEPNFNEKKLECLSRVQTVRSTLTGRSTKLAVVLLQKENSLPTLEDALASERASSLCSACELSNRSLFVLPLNHENLDGCIVRLENAFYELAQNYYHQEIRGVKSHRDFLNKTTHLYLFVRHQFKAGFLNELKRDFHSAYKHYGQAYSLLMEVRATDTNIMEVKTVAGFISYKICKLAFRLNLPRDAISQFRKHMDIFQQKIGAEELKFEHKGWQSMQCEVFADIFDEAIKNGLPAIQTQHPGLYYQQAAQYAIARREICEEQSLENYTYPNPDPLENYGNMEFFGQRPWRPGNVSLEPPDPSLERSGIQALLHYEKSGEVHHSEQIISLLKKSIKQFRSFNSPRSECHLTVTMAEELKSAQKYKEALDLLRTVLVYYKKENWRSLLDAVLLLALKCAFLLCDAAQYVKYALDLTSRESMIPEEDKKRIIANLFGVFDGKVPSAEPGLTSKSERLAVGQAAKSWMQVITESKTVPVQVEIGKEDESSIEIKSSFKLKVCKADENVELDIFVSNCTNFNVAITDVKVQTSSSEDYNLHWSGDSSIASNSLWNQSFNFIPKRIDVGHEFAVSSVQVRLGTPGNFQTVITKAISDTNYPKTQNFFKPREKLKASDQNDQVDSKYEFSEVPIFSKLEIQRREAKLKQKLTCQAPILIGEWFQVEIELENLESEPLQNIEIQAVLTEASDPIISDTTSLCFEKESLRTQPLTPVTPVNEEFSFSKPLSKGVDDLPTNGKAKQVLFIKASTTGMRGVSIATSYDITTGNKSTCSCQVEETLNLNTIEPFELDSELQSLRFQVIPNAFTDEVFFLVPKIKSVSPHILIIQDTKIDLRTPVLLDSDTDSQLAGFDLYPESAALECYPLIIRQENLLSNLDVQDISLGKYAINWQRFGDNLDLGCNQTYLDLPKIKVQVNGFSAFASLPAYGVVRTPLSLLYVFTNHTDKVQEFSLEVETSESFMLSGNKQAHFKILPNSEYQMNYVLYPLIAGYKIPLPGMKLTSIRINQIQDSNDVLNRMLPNFLTVLPRTRSENEIFSNEDDFYEVQQNFVSVNLESMNVGTRAKVTLKA